MLFLLYVLCSKIAIKKILFILNSREILRDVPCSQSGLWLKICWCVVCHIGAKRLNLGYFCPHVCGLPHFEALIRLNKSFSVYPVL